MEVRRFPRRPYNHVTGCLLAGSYFITQAIELGEGGMSLHATEVLLKKGDEVVLTFKLPRSNFIVQRAIVVNEREENGSMVYGFSFTEVNFDQKRDIRNFVSTH